MAPDVVGPVAVVLTGLLTGTAAILLNPWLRSITRTKSRWLAHWPAALLAAAAGMGAAAISSSWPELIGFSLLAIGCALLIVTDLATYRLPNIIVGPLYPILFAALTTAAATTGDWNRLAHSTIAAAGLALIYFILAFIAPTNLGLGDVKLSGLLGAFMGWLGWPHAVLGTLAAFILSALVAIILLLTTRATRRTEFPFGPAMIAGAALGAACGPIVFPAIG